MTHTITERARSLRRRQTEAEAKLWYYLRAKRFHNLKFKRQEPMGSYFVDFVCHPKKLIIELDGGHHAEDSQREYDLVRTLFLEEQGYRVLRFWNQEVMKNIEMVLQGIYEVVFGEQDSFDKVLL